MAFTPTNPDLIASGSLAAAAQTLALAINGQSAGTAQITGTWVGTITWEGTLDGTTWSAINAVSSSTSAPQTTTTVNGLYRITPGGLAQFRANMSAFTSGSATITLRASTGTGGIYANQIVPTTDATSSATGAAIPAKASFNGLLAKIANPTAATDGNIVGAMGDKLGRQVFVIGNVRDNKANSFTTITSSIVETTIIGAITSTFIDVYGVIIENTSATGTKVTFKDSTAGTTQFEIYVPATDVRGFMLPSSDGYKQTTVNTNWTATCGTSVASITISALYVKNI